MDKEVETEESVREEACILDYLFDAELRQDIKSQSEMIEQFPDEETFEVFKLYHEEYLWKNEHPER